MKKNLFISKKKYKLYFIALFLFLIVFTYIISFFIITNKKYFVILYNNSNNYYIIPEDKEGEKIKFTDKKSINNITSEPKIILNNFNKDNLKYTIQLFSDVNYSNVENYTKNILNLKSEIISIDQLYVFSINSQIGTDYFVTYKNFNLKIDAINFCKKLSFVKKCLIINPLN